MTEHNGNPGISRRMQWERKLLDLGLRNPLINLRMTKTQLPILAGSLYELENALADGSDFLVSCRPEEIPPMEITPEAISALAGQALLQKEFEKKRIPSALPQGETAAAAKEIYRAARLSMEENGANTLYLALGMLRWYETDRSEKPRYAPIILLPVEMVRRNGGQGYAIRLRDEEPQMNITLLEKLKQDFEIEVKGLNPLPQDEHGTDIQKVLSTVGNAVMSKPRWAMLETACLGIFSFSQFVMWNDLHSRSGELEQCPVVRSLMEGKLAWEAEPMEIGDRVEEDGVYLPMPADASQLFAIREACEGKSFVLHGPPGTGKSQTITSLIANSLAQGKTVLFVAEKMAALEVVQKRLKKIGIDPFCLELHSNKARKKNVLEQLRQASEVTRVRTPEEFARKARQIAAMRAELDDYAQQLHRVQPCGSTLYTLIGEYEACREARDLPPFSPEEIRGLDRARIENRKLLLEQLTAAAREIGHPRNHPLSRVGCTRYTQQLREQAEPAVSRYLQELTRLASPVTRLEQALNRAPGEKFEDLTRLAETARWMACWYEMPRAWTQAEAPGWYFGQISEMARHFLQAEKQKAELLTAFEEGVLALDGGAMFTEYLEVSGKWFLAKSMGLKKLQRKLAVFARIPMGKETQGETLGALRDYQQEAHAGEALLSRYGKDMGSLYCGPQTDWVSVEKLAGAAAAAARELAELTGGDEVLHSCCGRPELREAVVGLWSGWEAAVTAREGAYALLGLRECSGPGWLERETAMCQAILANAGSLKDWITYRAAADRAEACGLRNAVDAYAAGMAHEDVLPAVRKTALRGLICQAIDGSACLNRFSGAVFNEKIQQFRRADQEWEELSRQEIYCLLASRLPNFTREAAHSSELGILQRFIKSGGRGTSIRTLFEKIPNLLPRLCPCMLMSPISAAQYLDPGREPFDLVVFDEASQLPTCKAVGVLARGKHAVIVGDPRQMPPTSFFASDMSDEENPDLEDLESILDDCLALNMPQTHLLWHYRSRHESLIAFSNRQFYENRLYTFPSVNERASRVRLVHVDGVFERGGQRQNRAEAQAVLEELRRRCHDPEAACRSVGVVTFNIPQQNLIEDLLNEACAQDPELEKWAFSSEEPVFIKNLENVQGDERDVILFSVGYGPDENGKVYMNFGPLNREGGWRRLNVAVTRARYEMTVFATLQPEQMDLSRTKSQGAAALRAFLQYARNGAPAAEAPETEGKAGQISRTVCEKLRQAGYDTDLSVGHSGYRVDIGVADPRNPEKYLLGILLDGGSYGAAKTTRDRELAQIGVLKSLGWNILRIWSVDWWDNRDKELNRILEVLRDLETRKEAPETPAPRKQPEPPAAPVPVPAPAEAPEPPEYRICVLPEISPAAGDFADPANRKEIEARIRLVLEQEAPVCADVLIRRVVQSFGYSRAGSRLQAHMESILGASGLKFTLQGENAVYWRPDQNPDTYCGLRGCGEGENRRDIREVPVQEIANGLCAVLYDQISMQQEDLLRETGRMLGYSRLAGSVPEAVTAGIRWALDRNCIGPGAGGACVLTESGMQRAEAVLREVQNSRKN